MSNFVYHFLYVFSFCILQYMHHLNALNNIDRIHRYGTMYKYTFDILNQVSKFLFCLIVSSCHSFHSCCLYRIIDSIYGIKFIPYFKLPFIRYFDDNIKTKAPFQLKTSKQTSTTQFYFGKNSLVMYHHPKFSPSFQ